MKKLRNLVGLIAVLGMAAFMTGCGDDDNGDDNDNPNPGPQFAPVTQAGFQGQTYTVTTTTNGTATLTFPSETTYSFATDAGAETGTIANVHREGEDWVGTITPDSDQGILKAGEMRVHFTGANAGSFTAPGADGTVITGTFTSSGTGGGPGPGPGTDSGGGAGGDDLTGKTLQLTYSAGGERFTFNSPTAGTYENGNTISYTFDSTTGHLVIDGGPTATSHYDMTLAFNAGSTTAGTTTVQYSENGQVQSNDQASFTLQ